MEPWKQTGKAFIFFGGYDAINENSSNIPWFMSGTFEANWCISVTTIHVTAEIAPHAVTLISTRVNVKVAFVWTCYYINLIVLMRYEDREHKSPLLKAWSRSSNQAWGPVAYIHHRYWKTTIIVMLYQNYKFMYLVPFTVHVWFVFAFVD